jgi:hypothetical protein
MVFNLVLIHILSLPPENRQGDRSELWLLCFTPDCPYYRPYYRLIIGLYCRKNRSPFLLCPEKIYVRGKFMSKENLIRDAYPMFVIVL